MLRGLRTTFVYIGSTVAYVVLFRFLIDLFAVLLGSNLAPVERILTFGISMAISAALPLTVVRKWFTKLSEPHLAYAMGAGGFAYMYILYPALSFDQGLLLTLVQVFTDPVSVVNVVWITAGPVLVDRLISYGLFVD